MLPGRPAEGGFGTLPLEQHITARHAWWGMRLITEPDTAPWVAVARALLRAYAPGTDGTPLRLLGLPVDQPRLPDPLRRMHVALRALGPLRLRAGPWCWALPLWHNPAIPADIDITLVDVAAAGVQTLGALVVATRRRHCRHPGRYPLRPTSLCGART